MDAGKRLGDADNQAGLALRDCEAGIRLARQGHGGLMLAEGRASQSGGRAAAVEILVAVGA
jgi:hypothetical protein